MRFIKFILPFLLVASIPGCAKVEPVIVEEEEEDSADFCVSYSIDDIFHDGHHFSLESSYTFMGEWTAEEAAKEGKIYGGRYEYKFYGRITVDDPSYDGYVPRITITLEPMMKQVLLLGSGYKFNSKGVASWTRSDIFYNEKITKYYYYSIESGRL